jgi:hypothetical protein
MFQFKDFVPRMLEAPGFLKVAEHESFDEAVAAANQWVHKERIKVINIETVVLPNIWSRWEDGSTDTSLGTSGDSPSHWNQFVRVWYREDSQPGSRQQDS